MDQVEESLSVRAVFIHVLFEGILRLICPLVE